MNYGPQTINIALIRSLAKAPRPDKPREIRDAKKHLILRHQPSGYIGLYLELGRGKRERLCDARRIIDANDSLTLGMVKNKAVVVSGESAGGRDFQTERQALAAIPVLSKYLDDTYAPWVKDHRRSGSITLGRLKTRFPEFLDLRLDKITPAKLEAWKARRRAEVTPETINRDIATLRAALGRATKLIPELKTNPLKGVEMLEVDKHARRVRALTADEKARLIAALVERDDKKRSERVSGNQWRQERDIQSKPSIGRYCDVLTPAVIVSMDTGLRRGELFALEWPAIDLDEKLLQVTGATAKTFETREIQLNKTAFQTLRNWWLQQGQPKTGYVFTLDGGRLESLKKSYHAVVESAGIQRINAKGQRVVWHSLRHTFGTLLGAAGVDPTTLMELMGHANLSTTQRYLHTDDKRKRAAVELLA